LHQNERNNKKIDTTTCLTISLTLIGRLQTKGEVGGVFSLCVTDHNLHTILVGEREQQGKASEYNIK
jgi:hypothetical protein